MEWEQQNNEIDHKKVFIAVAILIAIALAASAIYYFAVFKKGGTQEDGGQSAKKELTEAEKVEIEKNLAGNPASSTLTKKEKTVIEKNFMDSGATLTEDEKRQIEKNFGL